MKNIRSLPPVSRSLGLNQTIVKRAAQLSVATAIHNGLKPRPTPTTTRDQSLAIDSRKTTPSKRYSVLFDFEHCAEKLKNGESDWSQSWCRAVSFDKRSSKKGLIQELSAVIRTYHREENRSLLVQSFRTGPAEPDIEHLELDIQLKVIWTDRPRKIMGTWGKGVGCAVDNVGCETFQDTFLAAEARGWKDHFLVDYYLVRKP